MKDTIYLLRYSYGSAWDSNILRYTDVLNDKVISDFLMMLPPFKENWKTEWGDDFLDQLQYYKLDDEFIFDVLGDEDVFLKIEDSNFDNHWCFIRTVEKV